MPVDREIRGRIASRIKEARHLAGLSQAQVAGFLGVSRPSVSEMENGNRAVAAEELARLAEIFDVSSHWLLAQGPDRLSLDDQQLLMAARQIRRLKPEDLERVLAVLAAVQGQGLEP